MASPSLSRGRALPESSPPAGDRVRLKLKPKSATTTGCVDGGWWPRSTDLTAELPALVAVLAVRLGAVERVSYRQSDWDPVEQRTIVVDGALIHLDGYRSRPAGTVDVIGVTQRVALLLVPPATASEMAHRALVVAGHRGNTDTVAELLFSPRVPDGVDAAQPGLDSSEAAR